MTPFETTLKLIIKEAIFEALDDYSTKIAPQTTGFTVSEPGTRKKRTAKAEPVEEIQTPELNTEMQSVADPAAEYKKIQQAVVTLVQQEGGKDKVMAVLDKFSVPTALKLTAEQYPEALSLLQQALDDAPLA